MTSERDELLKRVRALHLWGLVARWDEVGGEPWLPPLATPSSCVTNPIYRSRYATVPPQGRSD